MGRSTIDITCLIDSCNYIPKPLFSKRNFHRTYMKGVFEKQDLEV